jgi:Protoglobin
MSKIPGYTFGEASVARSPVSMADLELIQKTLLFGADDVKALKQSHDVLKDQVEAVLDVWYGFVGANPHLLASFLETGTNEPDGKYLEQVRKRFGQWILDTAAANYDQKWLDYQNEIGLRHHSTKKNKTDAVDTAALVPFRYLIALTLPVTTTLKPFLAKKGHSPADIERMHQAWIKSVLLQTILWSHPYVKPAAF